MTPLPTHEIDYPEVESSSWEAFLATMIATGAREALGLQGVVEPALLDQISETVRNAALTVVYCTGRGDQSSLDYLQFLENMVPDVWTGAPTLLPGYTDLRVGDGIETQRRRQMEREIEQVDEDA